MTDPPGASTDPTVTDQPTTTPRKRSWPRILVAAALAISGLSAIVYAGFLPLSPFSDVPVPIAWQVFGAAEVIAAVGVYLGRAWGRWLGVVVIVITILLATFRALFAIAGPDPALELGSYVVGIIIDVLILWWLLRRWPIVA